jgi:hypothetical protein
MKKKLLAALLTIQTVSMQAQDTAQGGYSDAVEYNTQEHALPLYLDTPVEVNMNDVNGNSCSKGFVCKLVCSIKTFFKNIITWFKNLFSRPSVSSVDIVVESVDQDVASDDQQENEADVQEADEEDGDSEDCMKVSSAKRKFLPKEPYWLQQRS